MKKRSGFVSNSSSSSFIIGKTKPSLMTIAAEAAGKSSEITVKEVALEFLKASKRMKSFEKLLKEPEDITYVLFPSMNEDTEIYKFKDLIIVSTCNNEWEAWDRAINSISETNEIVSDSESFLYDDDNYDEIHKTYEKAKDDKPVILEAEWIDEGEEDE